MPSLRLLKKRLHLVAQTVKIKMYRNTDRELIVMKVVIRAANHFVVTDAIKAHVEEKIGSLERFLPAEGLEARVVIKIYDVMQKVEVTIPGKQFILRAEESHADLYAAVDLVVEKLERQIRKAKTKASKKVREREGVAAYFANLGTQTEEVSADGTMPFKSKKMHLKPMDVEEAMMQFELLGHDFYVYFDIEVNSVCVLYLRQDGQIGVIETNY